VSTPTSSSPRTTASSSTKVDRRRTLPTFPATKTCVVCSQTFQALDRYQGARKLTCSPECAGRRISQQKKGKTKPLAERAGRMVPCAICGTETWKPDAWLKRNTETFCSSRCNGVRRAEELVKHSHKGKAGWTDASLASYREKMTGPNNPAWKGGVTVFKKHGNYAGVRYVRAPEWARPMARKDGYIMEHRLQMAVLCGYLLTRQEVVHHENHDPKDNRPENLTLWPSNRAHKLYEWGKMEEGASCRLPESRQTSWTMPEWCGASPSRTARSSPDAMG